MEEELLPRLKYGAAEMGFILTDGQLAQFARYAELLLEWNEKMNLTAITEPKEIVDKHFLDSLGAAKWINAAMTGPEGQASALSLIDVGTGAGFPGIPLKILFPELRLTLLDSLQKRLRFLETVVGELGLEYVECVHARAEEAARQAAYHERFDFATARAVAALPLLSEYCAGFVKPGGWFLAYKGPQAAEELTAASPLLSRLKLQVNETAVVAIPDTDYTRTVVILRKTAPLPSTYPRRPNKIGTV